MNETRILASIKIIRLFMASKTRRPKNRLLAQPFFDILKGVPADILFKGKYSFNRHLI